MTGHLITAPLHEETRPITTRPAIIPHLRYGWCAFRDGNSEAGPHGWATTEADAIAHLLELERR